ncbi:hypothetical protein [Streptomyces rhizosphaericus]|uniref:Uncharacterized protein n=1 Tax=Streptomyces rhizosphaericus TaxID=114699 RepID=A0A6G4AEK0_9ACTN|nr:hypothetical protein [Streptomyces rhizosphaericus]NEW71101.1 hypothetical protein [Streptomyces rhizosphaericus]
MENAHGLFGTERASDLPFDGAEAQQGQADDLDQGGDTPVVLHEDWGDGEGPLGVAVAALDRALAFVVDPDLTRVGFVGGGAGQQRVPAVDSGLRFQYIPVEVPGQGRDALFVLGDGPPQTGRNAALGANHTPTWVTIFYRVL